jgi:hypothetical protein
VPAPEFHFGITLADGTFAETGGEAHVLADVLRSVLEHAGLTGEAADPILDEMLAARRASPPGGCTLTFTFRAGELMIALSQAGHDWRMTCPVPIR